MKRKMQMLKKSKLVP